MSDTDRRVHPPADRVGRPDGARAAGGRARLRRQGPGLRRHGIRLPVSSLELARLLFAAFQGGALQHLLDPAQVGPDDLENHLVAVLEAALTRDDDTDGTASPA